MKKIRTISVFIFVGAIFLGVEGANAQCSKAVTGRCTVDECNNRHTKQVIECSDNLVPINCSGKTGNVDRQKFAKMNLSCLDARRYTSHCFDKTNDAHKNLINQLKRAILSCGAKVPDNPYEGGRP